MVAVRDLVEAAGLVVTDKTAVTPVGAAATLRLASQWYIQPTVTTVVKAVPQQGQSTLGWVGLVAGMEPERPAEVREPVPTVLW